jgi:hypothetical protein
VADGPGGGWFWPQELPVPLTFSELLTQ